MSQNLQNFAKLQKFQLDNLVDFEKCSQTHIFLHNFVLMQPRTSLPKIYKFLKKNFFKQVQNLPIGPPRPAPDSAAAARAEPGAARGAGEAPARRPPEQAQPLRPRRPRAMFFSTSKLERFFSNF